MLLVDTHCHLDFPDFDVDREQVIHRARMVGVSRMVTISTRVRKFDQVHAIAQTHEGIYCSVGTHPHNAHEELDITAEDLLRLADTPKVVAIGEVGLDYFYEKAPRDAQRQGLLTHIEAARRSGLPLVIHSREADEDMTEILDQESQKGRFTAILHCFTGGPILARRAIELGHYVSFSGILTFKKSQALRDIAANLPLDRILVETDAPYLAPGQHRGQRNEPSFVVETARVLAEVHNITLSDIASATTANAMRLFSRMT